MVVLRLVIFLLTAWALVFSTEVELLNVSFDPTREFYNEYNKLFEERWKKEHGEEVVVLQSHGGSGKQARAVIDGLQADVVTLALAYDIDAIVRRSGLIDKNWEARLPNHSAPFTSTIVLLVRTGNPKNIQDWIDLARSDVQVILPNPKTSGGARWSYLAAYGYGLKRWDGDEAKATNFLRRLLANVPILATGARAATTTFTQRDMGDVLVTWENEAQLALREEGSTRFEIVYPSLSILAEPPVAVVDKMVDKHHTRTLAEAYLNQLYSAEAQDLAAKHFYRPRDTEILAKYSKQFPAMTLMKIEDFGGWEAVQKRHFDEGGLLDQIQQKPGE